MKTKKHPAKRVPSASARSASTTLNSLSADLSAVASAKAEAAVKVEETPVADVSAVEAALVEAPKAE